MITGGGICHVYRNFDSRKRVCVGTLLEGSVKGETSVIFDVDPTFSIEAMSYCTIGMITQVNFLEFLNHFTQMRKFLIDQIIHNPYDFEREEFVKLCQNNIEFLREADQDVIRQLFYRTKSKFFEQGQQLFEVGQPCTEFFIIQKGNIDIILSDGYDQHAVLDTVGKGSIIGPNMILKQEKWPYYGVNSYVHTCKALCINYSIIEALRRDHKEIGDVITQQEDYFDIYGVPQIDYTIENLPMSPNAVQE